MAALIGFLRGSRGEVSRLGSKSSGISARLQTWYGVVQVDLQVDGTFEIIYGELNGVNRESMRGKVPV